MKKGLKKYWDSTSDIRNSLPNLLRPNNIFREEGEEDKPLTSRINENLLQYKEIRMIYNKTGIPPAYLLYLLSVCLVLIFIGFFESYLTHLIATLYPVYISIKTLQNPALEKAEISQWLTYWYYSFNLGSSMPPLSTSNVSLGFYCNTYPSTFLSKFSSFFSLSYLSTMALV